MNNFEYYICAITVSEFDKNGSLACADYSSEASI